MKSKNIYVTIEGVDGFRLSSSFTFPKYRRRIKKAKNPAFKFKEQEKDPVKWFKDLLNFG